MVESMDGQWAELMVSQLADQTERRKVDEKEFSLVAQRVYPSADSMAGNSAAHSAVLMAHLWADRWELQTADHWAEQ